MGLFSRNVKLKVKKPSIQVSVPNWWVEYTRIMKNVILGLLFIIFLVVGVTGPIVALIWDVCLVAGNNWSVLTIGAVILISVFWYPAFWLICKNIDYVRDWRIIW